MLSTLKHSNKSQYGFTLIEMMIVVAIIGIISAIAFASYQTQVRKTQVVIAYQEINHYRMPYQILVNEGAGPTGFSPSGLDMSEHTKNCQYSVTAPNTNDITPDAIKCQIQNLNYLTNQTLSLDLSVDGTWQCRASAGISRLYLPEDCR